MPRRFAGSVLLLSFAGCGGSDDARSQVADESVRGAVDPANAQRQEVDVEPAEPVLVETPDGLAARTDRLGQAVLFACSGTCEDFCNGCMLEACAESGDAALCSAGAQACSTDCLSCSTPASAGPWSCGAPACLGRDPSCYFRETGFPQVMRGVAIRPGSDAPISNPEPALGSEPKEGSAPNVNGDPSSNGAPPSSSTPTPY
jgi:hypothetical protein